ncbi:MAG: QacE family quaternary ammonium compound efflux SMR transporter [Sphingomonadaceae bacterium]|nr:QacE family quaternary ammonium compound efflux SMR transporter [Sphingomonadaceae bacterium]MBG76013.1 QacE family quaternary ammonium compound efflux SMR transporter [Erythrobacteraceae bacterium]|tara:strand:- start:717 stop:1046 length:330 start_codon:yes stop_codon:yes gene_type:complete
MQYLYLAIAIIGEVFATSFLRQTEGFTRLGPTVIALMGYLVTFYFLALALRTIPTGVAYAIWAGLGVVLVAGVAWVIQGQKLDTAAIIGMSFIVAGVVILNGFSDAVSH